MSELITASRLAAFRRCARYQQLRYDDRIEPAGADQLPRRWGSAFHRALEAWWLTQLDGNGAEAHSAAVSALDRETDLDTFERARAIATLAGYHARWQSEPLTVLAVEAEFEAPLVNPDSLASSRLFRVAGKIDAIVADADGKVWVVEHKTSTDDTAPGSPYWQRLRLDAQISIYLDGARALGYEPVGCIYDVISRPLQRPHQATPVDLRKRKKDGTLYANQRDVDETVDEFTDRVIEHIAERPEAYFQRGIVVRTGEEMIDARREVWNSARLLRFAQREHCSIRNPDACAPFRNSVCRYFDLCSGAASVDGVRYRISASAHPELTAPEVRNVG